MTSPDTFGEIIPDSREAWRAWLQENHASAPGVWVVYHKKGSDCPTVTYDEAVEEALCFGWIDSKVIAIDEAHYRQMYTPRKPGSQWSRSNKERVERVIVEGRMTSAGLAVIDAAKADGSWTFLDDIEALVVPDDLAAALGDDPSAEETFVAYPDSVKKQLLWWIATAKRQTTREQRIARTIEWAASGIRPDPGGPRPGTMRENTEEI